MAAFLRTNFKKIHPVILGGELKSPVSRPKGKGRLKVFVSRISRCFDENLCNDL